MDRLHIFARPGLVLYLALAVSQCALRRPAAVLPRVPCASFGFGLVCFSLSKAYGMPVRQVIYYQ